MQKNKKRIEIVFMELLIMEWICSVEKQERGDQLLKNQKVKNAGKSMGQKYMIYYSKDTLNQYLKAQSKEWSKSNKQQIQPAILKIKYIFDEFFQFVFGVTGDEMKRNPLGQYTAFVGIDKCYLLKRLDSGDVEMKQRMQNYVCHLMCGIIEGATQEVFGQTSTVGFKIGQNEKIEFSLVL